MKLTIGLMFIGAAVILHLANRKGKLLRNGRMSVGISMMCIGIFGMGVLDILTFFVR